MKVRAKRTYRNGFKEVVFSKGKTYEVTDVDKNGDRLWVLSELGFEAPIRKDKLERDFELLDT